MIVNCTPHPLVLTSADGEQVTIPPSGIIPRCQEHTTPIGTIDHGGVPLPLETLTYGQVTGLPEPRDGVFLVVSLPIAQAAAGRQDLLVGSRQLRDEQGRIVGCAALGRLTR